ncbi:MAG: BTAD domain-containing putative transcriptional regulator, partial [Pseudomonadota bacterium]
MSDSAAGPGRARLRLMGGFRLTGSDGRTVAVASRRARGLLSYLALAAEGAASRERLRGLLWSDRGEPQARASLRQCLLELRTALDGARLDLIEAGRETISLKAGAWTSDVVDLQGALAGADAAPFITALDLTGAGRLLEDLEIGGLFADWVAQARASLDQRLAAAVLAHLRRLEGEADWPRARSLADAYLRRDPLDEAVVAAAIRADAALGATGAAHRRFQSLQAALAKELGVSPAPATREALAGANPPAQDGPAKPAEPAALALPAKPSIAVLPFNNRSGDPEQEYLADGLTEDITAALSRWRWFFVIARNSSFTYKGRDIEPGRVGRELGVRYVLEGSVRKAGDRVRVTAQLVDLADGSHLWADKFDRQLIDILAL